MAGNEENEGSGDRGTANYTRGGRRVVRLLLVVPRKPVHGEKQEQGNASLNACTPSESLEVHITHLFIKFG